MLNRNDVFAINFGINRTINLLGTGIPLVALTMFAVMLPASQAAAVLIGNDVSVGRTAGSDGVTNLLQVYFNAPVPAEGTIDSFSIFDQTPDRTGHAYVLRPQGGGNYLVLSDYIFTTTSTTATNATKTFPVTPIDVLPGDLIAHYGQGVPYTDGTTPSSLYIFYPTLAQPALSSIITLPSTNYPLSATYRRDYAFAANFEATPPPAPEPTSLCLLGLGMGLLRFGRRRHGMGRQR